MALTKTNILYGPFNLVMTGGTGFSRTGLVDDSVVWGIETKKQNIPLEDGSERNIEVGRVLTMEITIDEVEDADLILIEACTALTIGFYQSDRSAVQRTITILAEVADTSTLAIFADVVDNKTKITIIKTAAAGKAVTDLMSIG